MLFHCEALCGLCINTLLILWIFSTDKPTTGLLATSLGIICITNVFSGEAHCSLGGLSAPVLQLLPLKFVTMPFMGLISSESNIAGETPFLVHSFFSAITIQTLSELFS